MPLDAVTHQHDRPSPNNIHVEVLVFSTALQMSGLCVHLPNQVDSWRAEVKADLNSPHMFCWMKMTCFNFKL